MKAYGVPRVAGLDGSADLVDIAFFGLKSSKSRVRSKCGDIKNSFRNPAAKARARRYWKRSERAAGKNMCLITHEE